jgi:hypothetical protein
MPLKSTVVQFMYLIVPYLAHLFPKVKNWIMDTISDEDCGIPSYADWSFASNLSHFFIFTFHPTV